jgi:hypothetical protein
MFHHPKLLVDHETSIMKTTLFLALSLMTLSALAADSAPKPPPTPPAPPTPPVEWIVEGYKAVDYKWVKQPDHCLKTTDLKQAVKYEAEIMRFQDWIARANIPALCSEVSDNVQYSLAMGIPDPPARVGFTVWAFHLENGKWVKDTKYCWTAPETSDSPSLAKEYAKKVNAVEGWCATTNAPESAAKPANQAAIYHGPLDTIGGCYGGGYYYYNGGSSSDTYINRRGRRVAYPDMTELNYGN